MNLRPDWEEIKDDVMHEALISKFNTHPELKEWLLSTGEKHIVEHTINDDYWGDGSNGDEIGPGKNMLG